MVPIHQFLHLAAHVNHIYSTPLFDGPPNLVV
jgi:hypothetical protein